MKHQWKTDDQGEIKPLYEDDDHPITQCVVTVQWRAAKAAHHEDWERSIAATAEEPHSAF